MVPDPDTPSAGRKPLLLHLCCGPCGTAVIERLAPEHDLTLLWYNPNIQPRVEFERRLQAARELTERLGLRLEIIGGGEEEFEELARGLEDLPEGEERCRRCYELRLRRAMEIARDRGLPLVATTLSISPHKSAETINAVGRELAAALGVEFLCADFKEAGGFERSVALSKEYGLYRQKYCGCRFSLPRRG